MNVGMALGIRNIVFGTRGEIEQTSVPILEGISVIPQEGLKGKSYQL